MNKIMEKCVAPSCYIGEEKDADSQSTRKTFVSSQANLSTSLDDAGNNDAGDAACPLVTPG